MSEETTTQMEVPYDPTAMLEGAEGGYQGKNYDFIIERSKFEVDKKYSEAAGEDVTFWMVEGLDSKTGAVQTLKLSCGRGWVPTENGQAVVNREGKQMFINTSPFGEFLHTFNKWGAERHTAAGNVNGWRDELLGRKFHHLRAASWTGAKLTVAPQEYYTDKKKTQVKIRDFPAAHLGWFEVNSAAAQPAAGSANDTSAPESMESIKAKLSSPEFLAANGANHDTWKLAAMALPEVQQYPELLGWLVQPSSFEALPKAA